MNEIEFLILYIIFHFFLFYVTLFRRSKDL